MDKRIIGIIAVVIVLVGVVGAVAATSKKNSDKKNNSNSSDQSNTSTTARDIKSTENADITIYFGQGCPHCKKVEDYITSNNVDQTVPLAMKEVWYNKDNASDMSAKADICKMDKDQLGVPLMYVASLKKCYTGDQDVINYLSAQVDAASKPITTPTPTPAPTTNQ